MRPFQLFYKLFMYNACVCKGCVYLFTDHIVDSLYLSETISHRSCACIVTSHIFHIIETLLHKNLYNKLEYKNSYIHHVF